MNKAKIKFSVSFQAGLVSFQAGLVSFQAGLVNFDALKINSAIHINQFLSATL